MSGWGWAWQAGTSRAHLMPLILVCSSLVYFSSNLFYSCTTTDQQSANLQKTDDKEDEFSQKGDGEFPHPKKANEHYTRLLVSIHKQPDADAVADCLSNVNTIAKEATNQSKMISSMKRLRPIIRDSLDLHHWCFYQMAALLDQKLAKGGGLMSELADKFLIDMKGLWIFGMALDKEQDTDKYFKYTQTRYLQISNDVFGRKLEVVTTPMRNVPAMYEEDGEYDDLELDADEGEPVEEQNAVKSAGDVDSKSPESQESQQQGEQNPSDEEYE